MNPTGGAGGVPTAAPPVAGIVLAAGRSTRMGEPKALLAVGAITFVEHAIRVLSEGGCRPIVAVVPAGEDRIAELARSAGARAVENAAADAEQIDSLRVGLSALDPEVVAAVVLPVDHPRARAATVAEILAAFRTRGAPIVRPVFGEIPGHPVLFAHDVWAELGEEDLEEGAREVVHRHRPEIEEVPVDDEGVAVDVNTPEEYARAVRGSRPSEP